MDYNLFKGLVTHVLDPSNFWMRIGIDSDMRLFSEYQQRLDAFYNTDLSKYPCKLDQMHAGYLVVVAKSTREDGFHWERAQVTRVDSDNNTADVFFVDLGFAYIVEVDRCRTITSEIFHFLALQASRVCLGGVKPLSSSWTTRATSLLQKETEDQELVTLLMHYDETSMCYTVVIYTKQSNGTWRSVIHKMQDEELAVGTEDIIQEVLTDDIVEQCLQKMEERNEQYRATEANDFDDHEETLVEEDKEKWEDEDDHVVGASDSYLANLMKASNNSRMEDCQEEPHASDKDHVVTGFDIHTLLQTRSISLSQMQLEKVTESQEVTKTNIERDLQRLESCNSQNDDQDWDLVQDTDYHVDIMSQIYHGVPERQYSSDDGMSEFWDGSKLHELALPVKKPEATVATATSSSANKSGKKDVGRRYYHPVDKEEEDADDKVDSFGVGDPVGYGEGGGLTEMDSYRLEKQIKEILMNPKSLESDVVCASIYSVVEPDVDAPVDHLCVVICAILEHIIQDSSQHSEIAFAILDAYSDAIGFGTAIVQVINELKDRLVKKSQNLRMANRHKDFAKVLASVFKQAEDWEGSCKAVQDLALAMVEKWVIFNKQRHLSGDDLVQCELLFLETAQTFLMGCYDLVLVKYPSNLTEIMKDIRCKLLQDKTVRSLRTFLLDMFLALNLNSGGSLDKSIMTCSVATQTEEDVDSKSVIVAAQVGSKGDAVSTNGIVKPPVLVNDQRFPGFSSPKSLSYRGTLDTADYALSQSTWGDLPKNVKNLPPRLLLKKYIHENGLAKPNIPSVSSGDTAVTFSEAKPCDDDDTQLETIACGDSEVSELMSSSDVDHFSVPTPVLDTVLPSPSPVSKKMSPSPSPAFEKVSTSLKTVTENMLPADTIKDKMSSLPADVSEKISLDNTEGKMSPLPKTVNGKQSLLPETIPCPQSSPIPVEDEGYSLQTRDEENETGIPTPATLEENENFVGNRRLEQETKDTSDRESARQETYAKETIKEQPKDIVRIEWDTMIRYTPKQLRDLNPFEGQPSIPVWDLWEPWEVLEKYKNPKNPGKSAYANESEYFKSKSDINWKIGIGKRVSCRDQKDLGSSVDPSPIQGVNNNNNGKKCGENLFEKGGNIYLNHGSGLQGIASDLFGSTNKAEGEGGEMWHDGDDDGAGEFGETGTKVGDLLKPKTQNVLGKGKKAKKKRGREIPLDQYLQEQEIMNQVEEREVGGDDGDDLFGPEALKMYEELEQQGVGVDAETEGLTRVSSLPAKFGSHISSSSKRPGMFSSIATGHHQSSSSAGQEPSKPWAPSRRRFCTRCGSKDHVVYDCDSNTSRLL